jgi:hypothetical protein
LSFLLHHHILSSPLHLALNHAHPPGLEPLLFLERCGFKEQRLCSLRSEDAAAAAPPLSRGMWLAYCRSMEEWGREARGETQEVGDPVGTS